MSGLVECSTVAPLWLCHHRDILIYLAPSLLLALLIRALSARHPFFFLFTLAGTICHELVRASNPKLTTCASGPKIDCNFRILAEASLHSCYSKFRCLDVLRAYLTTTKRIKVSRITSILIDVGVTVSEACVLSASSIRVKNVFF